MSDNNGNIHQGHRGRMRNEYIENGAASFNEIRILEMLLFYALRDGDTNPLAHRLINRFGTLYNVLTADIGELKTVEGVGDYTAVLIHLVSDIYNKALVEKEKTDRERIVISGTDVAGSLICSYFANEKAEKFMAFFLDANNALVGSALLGTGVVNSVNIEMRHLVEECIHRNCTGVIIAHNHPDGNINPSNEDKTVTERIQSTLASISIFLLDHVIVSGSSYYSFLGHGLM